MAFKKLVIASGQVSGASHSDFPILIQPSKMTGWEALTLAEAESIRIYTDEAKTNEVAREVVDDSPDEIWVKVPTLTSSTELYVDYDGVRSDLSVGATYGRNAVWGSAYESVWHMNDITATTIADSTSNANDGTKLSSDQPKEVSGGIGKAQSFDGSNDYINVGTLGTFASEIGEPSGHVYSFYIAFPVWSVDRRVFGTVSDGNNLLMSLGTVNAPTNGMNLTYRASLNSHDYALRWEFVDAGLFDGNDHKLDVVVRPPGSRSAWSDSDVDFYVDGVKKTTASAGVDRTWGDNNDWDDIQFDLILGGWNDRGSLTGFIETTISEARFVKTNSFYTQSWITTEYNNQNDVGEFWGTVTDAGGDPPAVADTGFFAFM